MILRTARGHMTDVWSTIKVGNLQLPRRLAWRRRGAAGPSPTACSATSRPNITPNARRWACYRHQASEDGKAIQTSPASLTHDQDFHSRYFGGSFTHHVLTGVGTISRRKRRATLPMQCLRYTGQASEVCILILVGGGLTMWCSNLASRTPMATLGATRARQAQSGAASISGSSDAELPTKARSPTGTLASLSAH